MAAIGDGPWHFVAAKLIERLEGNKLGITANSATSRSSDEVNPVELQDAARTINYALGLALKESIKRREEVIALHERLKVVEQRPAEAAQLVVDEETAELADELRWYLKWAKQLAFLAVGGGIAVFCLIGLVATGWMIRLALAAWWVAPAVTPG